jgi:hypothetical protein
MLLADAPSRYSVPDARWECQGMRAVESQLRKQLATASGRGPASVSALCSRLSEPITVWTPEASEEPAFLAYSVTKTFTSVGAEALR